jgi:hypothetical protein
VPVGVGVVAERDVEPVAQLDEAGHRIGRGRVHPDPAVPVAGHEPELRVDRVVGDRQVESVTLADRRPVGDARATERVDPDAEPGCGDRRHVDDVREVVHVVAQELVLGRRGACLVDRHPLHAGELGLEQAVGLVLDPARDVRVGRTAVRRVVLEPAVLGRVVRRGHDDPIGESRRPAPVVDEDRVRHRGRRRVAVGGVDPHVDTVGDEDLEGGLECGFGQRMGIATDEQRTVGALLLAVSTDGFGRRQDMGLVERRLQRGTAMTRRSERDALRRIARIGPHVAIRGDQPIEIDELFGVSGPAGLRADRHRGPPAVDRATSQTGDPRRYEACSRGSANCES